MLLCAKSTSEPSPLTSKDDPLASTIRGRPIKATVTAVDLERVQRCVEECDREHDNCHRHPGGPAPQRLLDLQASKSKSNETVKLVALGDNDQEKYAALSYPSDSGIVSCLEPSMLVEGNEIQVDHLPQTFQDAILATRASNVQYLWIDSLCVPGNLSEWDRSSPQAGSVYSNAYVTISATGATDALGGLFVSRPEPKYVPIPYKTQNGTSGTALAFILPLTKEVIRSRYIEMPDEPISKGVWSFQERVLSSRVVHFASDQVYVECMRQFVSEDGLLERQRYHTTAEALPSGTRHHFSQELTRSPKERWFDMLWHYARREPAVSTDKLTALSNVARAFQRMNDGGRGEYIAGHWKDSFLESLCWQSLKCKPAGDSDAPSWSWISVDGIPAMGFGTDIPSYLATVVATHVNLQDATNPFGRVTEASITLEAPPLIPLRIVEEHEFEEGRNVYGQVYVQSESESGERIYAGLDTMDRRLVSANALREMKLFALVLAETRPDGECCHACPGSEETLHGLIVTPAQASGEKTMRRLGFFLADRSDLGPSSLFDSREVTTLV